MNAIEKIDKAYKLDKIRTIIGYTAIVIFIVSTSIHFSLENDKLFDFIGDCMIFVGLGSTFYLKSKIDSLMNEASQERDELQAKLDASEKEESK